MKRKHLISAGGVVLKSDTLPLVVLCGLIEPQQWRLPKGGSDPGETLEDTAIREVREETGLHVQILRPLSSISYWFVKPLDGTSLYKTVHFFLMEPVGGSFDQHDHEFDLIQWFPIEDAMRKVTYSGEAGVLEEVNTLLLEGNSG